MQTIPDVFQKLKTYSVPEEDKPIRRGGNGQLFETEYFGYSMVAKKTLFRNREYNIILRLNHGNIVPLLAVMVGEVFHKRRFYCYHMLPRMSGKYGGRAIVPLHIVVIKLDIEYCVPVCVGVMYTVSFEGLSHDP